YDSLKKILPETPQKIDTETVEILPFNLPITKRSQTGIIVKALRLIYKFNTLPDSYFTKLPKLPEYPDQIIEDKLKNLFPITSSSQLSRLGTYKRKLADYYDLERIPSSYFNLLPPKQP